MQVWEPWMITEEHVEAALRSLREQSATGPDLIGARVLKRCSTALAVPVHKLLQRILVEGEWPSLWASHWLVPIYKRKAAGDPGNYRGVHLTAQISKVCERLVMTIARPPHCQVQAAWGEPVCIHQRQWRPRCHCLPLDILDICAQWQM